MDETNKIRKARENLKKNVYKTYKGSLWSRFKDAMGIFFLAILLLICIFGFFYLLITLIENPLSLAIFCITVLLIIIWERR